MLFNLEYDAGNIVEGYLVPDGFEDRPRIAVLDGDELLAQFDCDELRDAVRVSGRHATGRVGFRLDESILPGLQGIAALAIRDAATGLLIYRRANDRWKKRRIMRLETQLVPSPGLDHSLEGHFQYSASRVERFGLETALQVFHLNQIASIHVSGRLQLRSFEHFLERGFEVITFLADPYYQMAESILFLKRFPTFPEGWFGPRDAMMLEAAASYFADVDPLSPKLLAGALKSLDPALSRLLKNPVTRQLTSAQPDDNPGSNSVAMALDMISRFAVIGLRSSPQTFILPASELLGLEPDALSIPGLHPSIAAVAGLLRELPNAGVLLELDLIVYHFVSKAIAASSGQSRPACA